MAPAFSASSRVEPGGQVNPPKAPEQSTTFWRLAIERSGIDRSGIDRSGIERSGIDARSGIEGTSSESRSNAVGNWAAIERSGIDRSGRAARLDVPRPYVPRSPRITGSALPRTPWMSARVVPLNVVRSARTAPPRMELPPTPFAPSPRVKPGGQLVPQLRTSAALFPSAAAGTAWRGVWSTRVLVSPMFPSEPVSEKLSIGIERSGKVEKSIERSGIERNGEVANSIDRSGIDPSGELATPIERSGIERSGKVEKSIERSGIDRSGIDRSGTPARLRASSVTLSAVAGLFGSMPKSLRQFLPSVDSSWHQALSRSVGLELAAPGRPIERSGVDPRAIDPRGIDP